MTTTARDFKEIVTVSNNTVVHIIVLVELEPAGLLQQLRLLF
jgi:hypothetical protein